MNTVILTGRLTRDVELSNTQGGTGYLRNCLAVKNDYKNKDGEYDSSFFNFASFGKTAEIIANYCSKGSLILIKGHLGNGKITNDKNQVCTTTEIIVDSVELVEPKRQSQQVEQQPTTTNNNFDTSFDNVKSQFDISSEDLPF